MSLELPYLDDMHVHLRQGEFSRSLVHAIRAGGSDRVLVMPNTAPPITSAARVSAYVSELKAADPTVDYLMTLFLCPELSTQTLRDAQKLGAIGVKCYPKGVTTGSQTGVESFDGYAHLFQEMEELGMSLHLHGEVPGECVMTAEETFLAQLFELHAKFPRLKIVLEHVTSAKGVQAVKACGSNVAATITAHHLDLTIDDVVGNSLNFCKPVAKLPQDRAALRQVVLEGDSKFFLGSDSAPHPVGKKICHGCAAAGIFSQPYLALYLADTFDRLGCLDKLEAFACRYGAQFFGLKTKSERVLKLFKKEFIVPTEFKCSSGDIVIPFRAGETLGFSFTS